MSDGDKPKHGETRPKPKDSPGNFERKERGEPRYFDPSQLPEKPDRGRGGGSTGGDKSKGS